MALVNQFEDSNAVKFRNARSKDYETAPTAAECKQIMQDDAELKAKHNSQVIQYQILENLLGKRLADSVISEPETPCQSVLKGIRI